MKPLRKSSRIKFFEKKLYPRREFQKQLQQSSPFIWVADSALYTVDKLLNLSADNWITMVPNTIVAVKSLCEAPEEQFQWQEIENGYKMVGLGSNYGDLKQRWILIHSKQAFKRESATFEKNLNNFEEKLSKEIWHLGNQIFSKKTEAIDAFMALNQTAKYHKLDYSLQPVRKYSGQGRPKTGQKPKLVGYLLKVIFSRNEDTIAIAKNAFEAKVFFAKKLSPRRDVLSSLQIT